MPRRILYKDNSLPGSENPSPGYKFVGYNGLTYSQLDSNGNITPIGGGVSSGSNSNYTYEIGQYVPTEGGVVFYRWIDPTGASGSSTENYLISATGALSTAQAWSNIDNTNVGTASSFWNGLLNSQNIINQPGESSSAARLCMEYDGGSKTDWYLPSYDELYLLHNSRFNIGKTLSGNSNYGIIPGAKVITVGLFWSSTEMPSVSNQAYYVSFINSSGGLATKNSLYYVIAIRKISI